jgi:hypothetical protein
MSITSAHKGKLDPELSLLSHETWFYLYGYANTQNKRYENTDNRFLYVNALLNYVTTL